MIDLRLHSAPASWSRSLPRGFTLIELMVTLVVLSIVMLALVTVMYTASRNKTSTVNLSESSSAARVATDLIARDLRSAGYGADLDYTTAPQRPIAYIDSLTVLINSNQQPYPDAGTLHGWPLAYNPASAQRPFPLDNTAWQPPICYRTGAEIVAWTLDINNDGVVNAVDLAAADGIDAQRTPNPNDYELVRRVYGDSISGGASNGGLTERVALVAKPGGGVSPMFTVYFKGSTTPYNWSSGPVPVSQLSTIDRIVVQVTASSGKPDAKGNYATTKYSTEVNSMRNVPDFGDPLYGVDGYVFNDNNPRNGTKDTGEPGISGASVNLGIYSATTDANGHYLFQVPKGTYTLRHTPPANFGVYTQPDSFVVTLPPATSKSFADTAKAGGWVHGFAWNDANQNGSFDTGESPLAYVQLTMSGGGGTAFTDASGYTDLFASVGGYAVTATPPDSFACSTTNPVTGSMTNGGSASIQFGMYLTAFGTIAGTVFNDANRDGIKQGTEVGMANAWVGVSPDGGVTVKGAAYTATDGTYSIQVPINDPPHTTALYVMVVAPTGFYPTSTTSLGPVWIQANQNLSGYNFGMSSFKIITLNANRVLSLANGNLVEKDGGDPTKFRMDADIVLGADAGGTDQISVWFNQWNNNTLFASTSTYARSAPNSVMSLSLARMSSDTLPDLVTGTKVVAAGNFFVWLDQSTSGNEGYFPTTYTSGLNYKTLDNGDVQSVLTADVSGTTADRPDIIVGSKSPTAGQGSIEIWKNTNAGTGAGFTRDEIYPPAGGLSAGSLGEVNAMVFGDFDEDGNKDLAVATTTGTYSGKVRIFKFLSRSTLPHYTLMATLDCPLDAVTALAAVDVNQDGHLDLIAGTQSGTSSGHLFYYRNNTPSPFDFGLQRTVDAPGIVLAEAVGDFGGSAGGDLVVGYRGSTTDYSGGVSIYYLDTKNLPPNGTDPSAGAVANMAPAITVANFNFGINPSGTAPYLTDMAVGVKSGASTGALVLFIR